MFGILGSWRNADGQVWGLPNVFSCSVGRFWSATWWHHAALKSSAILVQDSLGQQTDIWTSQVCNWYASHTVGAGSSPRQQVLAHYFYLTYFKSFLWATPRSSDTVTTTRAKIPSVSSAIIKGLNESTPLSVQGSSGYFTHPLQQYNIV